MAPPCCAAWPRPFLERIPVVVMSSLPEATVAERCSGYAAFMLKPFKIAEVKALSEGLIIKGAASSA